MILVIICSLISAALALTYNVTGVAELGNGYSKEQLAEYAALALPEADELMEAKFSLEDKQLLHVYKAKNGVGMAIVLVQKGYSSDGITMMVGLDPNGVVQGIATIAQTETPGIGDKVTKNRAYLDKFVGNTKDTVNVDIIANATKTSKGFINGCKKAMELFDQLKGEVLGS
ncbi:MAG: FMN-binding protein, partial [Oscillospiraceae bacterium]